MLFKHFTNNILCGLFCLVLIQRCDIVLTKDVICGLRSILLALFVIYIGVISEPVSRIKPILKYIAKILKPVEMHDKQKYNCDNNKCQYYD